MHPYQERRASVTVSSNSPHSEHRPVIAVFDTGSGGLTVLRAIVSLVPNADYLYFGDFARLPYGTKSRQAIARYTTESAHFLRERGAEMLVIGCNTATAIALEDVQNAVDIPVIGIIEPGANRAAELSCNRAAIVIATLATAESHAYQRALARRGVTAYEKACTLLSLVIEEGWGDLPVTEHVARIYIDEALRCAPANADVMVLGCTHYPLILPVLRRIVPPQIILVDPALSTAQVVASELKISDGQQRNGSPEFRFYVTDTLERFKRLAPIFLGEPIDHVELVDIEVLNKMPGASDVANQDFNSAGKSLGTFCIPESTI
jgi:glutamate racemase